MEGLRKPILSWVVFSVWSFKYGVLAIQPQEGNLEISH